MRLVDTFPDVVAGSTAESVHPFRALIASTRSGRAEACCSCVRNDVIESLGEEVAGLAAVLEHPARVLSAFTVILCSGVAVLANVWRVCEIEL